jgi:hypothetical protein
MIDYQSNTSMSEVPRIGGLRLSNPIAVSGINRAFLSSMKALLYIASIVDSV